MQNALAHPGLLNRRFDPIRAEGLIKCCGKLVASGKVFDVVLVGLTEDFALHQIEDDVTKIAALADAPVLEHRARHGAVLVNRVKTDTIEQLLASQVVRLVEIAALVELFQTVIKRLP